MNKTQQGFALLETLLILIIVAIIGGTGYFVWHSKGQTDNNLSNAAASSVETAVSKKPTSKTASSNKTLLIKEWGVKAQYTSSVDLIYTVTSDDLGETWANFSSVQMKEADSRCDEKSQLGGIIIKIHSGEDLRGPAGDDIGQTIESAISSGVLSEYSHVGQYYYFYQRPQAACGSDGSKADLLQSPTLDAVKEAAKNFVSAN